MNKYDLFMNALYNACPSLMDFANSLNSNKSNNTVKTFEDCAKVEKDINDRINKAYYLYNKL